MDFLTSPKYDGFPKPGPSFNPLKFKSMKNYRHYTQIEEAKKAAAKERKKLEGQEVPSIDMKPVKKMERDTLNLSVRNTENKVNEHTAVIHKTEVAQKESAITKEGKEMEEHISTVHIIEVAKGEPVSFEEKKQKKYATAPHDTIFIEDASTMSRKGNEEKFNKAKKLDDSPRPGPSFNPLEFQSREDFAHYSDLEAKKKVVKRDSTAAGDKEADSFAITNADTKKERDPADCTTTRPSLATINAWCKARRKASTAHTEQKLNNPTTKQIQSVVELHPSQVTKPRATEERADTTETLRLVSIRRVKSVHETKVENRWLTLAEIDGWVCIVPRRSFKPGELVLYLEVDSFIPAADERFGKQQPLITLGSRLGHRVKTRRVGSGSESVLVQGLVYPLEKFPEIQTQLRIVREAMETVNTDEKQINSILLALFRKENWAEKLGILKWSETKQAINIAQQQLKVGKIPTHLFPKTDISRLEDCPNLFKSEKYKKLEYQESVKMDGTSMTVYFVNKDSRLFRQLNAFPATAEVGPNMALQNGRFGVCSKNWELHELGKSDSVGYWETALRLDLPAKMARLGHNIAIQGELCGQNINKNRECIVGEQPEFFVFSMYHMETRKPIDPRKVVRMAENLGLQHVPVLGYVKIQEIAANREALKKRARQRIGEGLVYKCLQDGRSFKVISSTYLLEHNL